MEYDALDEEDSGVNGGLKKLVDQAVFLQYVHYTREQNQTLMQNGDVVTKKDAVFFLQYFIPSKLILEFLGVNGIRLEPNV